MVVQTPPPPPAPQPPAAPDVPDAGVIEDARARQRRHRLGGAILLLVAAAAAAAGLIVGTGGGGAGGGTGRAPSGHPSGGGAGAGSLNSSQSFPGAPAIQNDIDGPSSGMCTRAAPNRYLPPNSGCVSVRRVDVTGDGRADLVLVYSRIAHTSVATRFPGLATPRQYGPEASHLYYAKQAFLRVVQPGGTIVTTAVGAIRPVFREHTAKAAAFASIGHFNGLPGKEIFLEISHISSGSSGVAYALHRGRLVAAGAPVYFGGDSGGQTGFDCLPGNPPRFVQRQFDLPRDPGAWHETDTIYAWHGPKLVKVARHISTRRFPHSRYGWPPKRLAQAGPGCNQPG